MATDKPAPPTKRRSATEAVLLLLVVGFSLTACDVPELQIVESHAKDIQRNLLRYLETNSGLDVLTLGYRDVGQQYTHLNGTQLVQEMAFKLEKMFTKKLSALKRLKEKAEDTVRDYQYDSMIKMCDVKYFNMKNPHKNETVDYNSRFQQGVNLSTSGVHIPLEIYEGYPEILNGLKWSESLDTTFKQNYDENHDTAWQFFGSQNGFMRVYPANIWKDIHGIPDLYDVRRRPWYIQGSTSPKDMLILMDVSGSVHGQTFEIMKISVKTLLNTLEENDYVNVAWFSNTAGWVTCFDTFVQANSWNKKVLFDGIDNLKDGNMASYANALEFAFEEFHKFSENKTEYEGSECHKVIMFFTDGGTERPDEVIKKYNEDKEIRIFSYAVGPHAVPVHTIKWLACQNRGYFNTISAMGAVRTKIQQYPSVLARPLALHENNAETYSTVYTDAGGMGMVITITLPVFNRSEESRNQTVVGVVGIDTPVEDFEAVMPTMQAGPNTYSFAINPNGFVILHPKMRSQRVYLEDAPDIDFLDLEEDDPSQEAYISVLRKDMIDEKTGSHQFRTYVNTGDDYHTIQKNLTYYFAPIQNTTLSLGMAIAEDRKGYVNVTSFNTYKGIDMAADEGFLVAPWKYCIGVNTTLSMEEFITRLSEEIKRNFTYCDKGLVRHLLWDIERTSKAHLIWKIKKPNVDGKRISVFVGTEGGFTRFFPLSELKTFRNVRDTFKATYFKKALYYPTWTFLISDEFDDSTSGPFVTAVKPIADEASKQRYKPAVFGVHLNESAVYELLSEKCRDMEEVVCYLLDDGGFIVSSNQPHRKSQMGKFLGEEDAMLMWNLNNRSIYKRRLEYDYHAVCTRIEPRVSAGPMSLFTMPPLTVLLKIVFHSMMDSIIGLLVSGWNAAMAQGTGEVSASLKASNYSCTKVRALYYFMPINENNGPSPVDDEMVCGNCTRNFAAVRLQQTNLLLVVATDSPCPVSECMEVEQLNNKPTETDGPNVCQLTPRYRRRPKGCFANHNAEDASECSAGCTTTASTLLPIVASFAALLSKCTLWPHTPI